MNGKQHEIKALPAEGQEEQAQERRAVFKNTFFFLLTCQLFCLVRCDKNLFNFPFPGFIVSFALSSFAVASHHS